MTDTSVIIAAAGSAARMNGLNKQLLDLCGTPVIGYSLKAFEACDSVGEIIVVAREADCEGIVALAQKLSITKFKAAVIGGKTRQTSVINGLKSVSKELKMLAVHDGARPLITSALIEKAITDARVFGGATVGVPVKDTIKTVSGGLIVDTPDRSALFAVGTPQVFKKSLYFEGVDFAAEHGLDFTDDCQLVEAIGVRVALTLDDYRNIKLTTREDIALAEAILGGKCDEN